MLRLVFNNYFFASFTVLKAQYIVPSLPKQIKTQNQERFLISKIQKEKNISAAEAKKIYESDKNDINQKYQKEYEEVSEKLKYNQHLKATQDNKEARQEWKNQYDIPKKPIGEAFQLRLMVAERFKDSLQKSSSVQDYTRQISEIMAKEKDLVEQLKVEAKKICEENRQKHVEIKQKYEKKYGIPQLRSVSMYQTYTQGRTNDSGERQVKDLAQGFKSLNQEELKQLQIKADQLQEENQRKLRQLSIEYGMSFDEFINELKDQIKLYKQNKVSKQKKE